MDSARVIENLLYTYAERIDNGDFEGVADLFAHGRIAASEDATPEQMIAGREAVLNMYQSTTRIYEDDSTPKTRHVTTNAIIEVDEDAETAASRCYYTVFQQTDVLPLQPIIAGHYHDTFHKVDGAWCFDQRTMFMDRFGDLSQHLLFNLNP